MKKLVLKSLKQNRVSPAVLRVADEFTVRGDTIVRNMLNGPISVDVHRVTEIVKSVQDAVGYAFEYGRDLYAGPICQLLVQDGPGCQALQQGVVDVILGESSFARPLLKTLECPDGNSIRYVRSTIRDQDQNIDSYGEFSIKLADGGGPLVRLGMQGVQVRWADSEGIGHTHTATITSPNTGAAIKAVGAYAYYSAMWQSFSRILLCQCCGVHPCDPNDPQSQVSSERVSDTHQCRRSATTFATVDEVIDNIAASMNKGG